MVISLVPKVRVLITSFDLVASGFGNTTGSDRFISGSAGAVSTFAIFGLVFSGVGGVAFGCSIFSAVLLPGRVVATGLSAIFVFVFCGSVAFAITGGGGLRRAVMAFLFLANSSSRLTKNGSL